MSLGGIKQRLLIDIITLLFGEPAAIIADAIATFGPCPIGLIAQKTHFPEVDARTIALSMYVHGVVNISQEGNKKMVSISTLPAYILSTPSLLIDQIEDQFKSVSLCETLKLILFHGIIEYATARDKESPLVTDKKTPKNKKKKAKATSIPVDLPDDFEECIEKLLDNNLLVRRVVEYESFTTTDAFCLRRRIDNFSLTKKRTSSASNSNLSETIKENSIPEPVRTASNVSETVYSLTINWNGVATYLRGRFLVQFSQVALSGDFAALIESILEVTRCSDYTNYQYSMNKDDDGLKGEVMLYPRLEYSQITQKYNTAQRDELFTLLDTLADSQMDILKSGDGSFWDMTTPKAIRAFQLHHIEMYLEQSLSAYHRRCFNQLRSLGVADTHQIELNALLSEKDARSSIYALCKLGFAQMQSVPRSATDRMINPKSIFVWRYDEESAIEAYRLIIGEHARRYLARITQLHDEYEQNESAEAGNMTATKTNEKKEKHLCCFNAAYTDAMRVFILFAEM